MAPAPSPIDPTPPTDESADESTVLIFSPGQAWPPTALQARLPGYEVIAEPLKKRQARRTRRVYLDTFAYTLHQQGLLLEWCDLDCGTLSLLRAEDGTVLARGPTAAPPTGLADLGKGALARRLSAPLAGLCLQPAIWLSGRMERLRVVNASGKMEARIEFRRERPEEIKETKEAKAKGAGTKEAEAKGHEIATLVVDPLPGYPRSATQIAAALRALGATPLATDPLTLALALLGRSPQPPAIEPPTLTAEQPPAAALKRVLLYYAACLEGLLPEVLAGQDPESLHDFRVAIRRTRALLSALGEALPAREVARYRQELSWLQQESGPLRDLDVYLQWLSTLAQSEAPWARDLLPVLDHLQGRRAEAQAAWQAVLASPRCTQLLPAWRHLLETRSRRRKGEPGIGPWVGGRIWRLYRKTCRLGHQAETAAEIDPILLHELRKRCKKLRYVQEAFRDVLPALVQGKGHSKGEGTPTPGEKGKGKPPGEKGKGKPQGEKGKGKPQGDKAKARKDSAKDTSEDPIKALKGLQEVLGEAHDAHVHQQVLRELAAALAAETAGGLSLPVATALQALGALRRAAEREANAEFESCFRRFAKGNIKAAYRHLRHQDQDQGQGDAGDKKHTGSDQGSPGSGGE
jgi:CHAD domain-containing protein